MHHSRLCAVLVDCKTPDVDEAANFWSQALGRAVDPNHPGTRGNYRMLDTPPDAPIVQIQRVEHESRVHLDIETDDIPAEVERLTKLGATVVDRLERWVVMQAPTGQRFCAPDSTRMNRIIRKDSLFNCSLRIPPAGAFRPLVIGTGSL